MKRLSVIIVTFHSENDIYDCLHSLWQHSDIAKDELEVIVVDNSPSSASMFARLKELYGDDIILLHNSHNGGYGQGNNVGIRHASAPVVLIMNPDVRLYEPVFKTALEAFSKDSQLNIYGMKQMCSNEEPSPYSIVCTYMMNGYLFTLLTSLANRFDFYMPRYMYVSGSCFFVRRDAIEAIGLYDESNFMYGEEDDIHHRMMRRYGTSMVYNHQLHYIHPMHTREPSIAYEKKLIDTAIVLNEKNGYPRRKTLVNRLRNMRLLLMRERLKRVLGKGDEQRWEVMRQKQTYIKELLKQQ